MQNSVNHRVFERKWRRRSSRRHVCLSVRFLGGRPAYCYAVGWRDVAAAFTSRLSSQSTLSGRGSIGVELSDPSLSEAPLSSGVLGSSDVAQDDAVRVCCSPAGRTPELGPQIRRDDPLNLSISISGGKETNQDSPSNGERSGNSSSRQSLVSIASELWPVEAGAPDATSSKLTWKGTSERVIAPCVAESPREATVF